MKQKGRLAKIVKFFQTKTGEEVLEGTLGGLLAGIPMFFSGQDPRTAALATIGGVAGGIGIGMAGRRLGEFIGSRLHPEPLADQAGVATFLARAFGQETMGKALEQNFVFMREAVKNAMLDNQLKKMVEDGRISEELMADLRKYQTLSAIASAVNDMPSEQRRQLLQQFDTYLTQADVIAGGVNDNLRRAREYADRMKEVGMWDAVAAREAAANLDEGLREFAENMRKMGNEWASDSQPFDPNSIADFVRGVADGNMESITGEHVGRAVGRFIGDEIGVLSGVGLGVIGGNLLGFQTPQEREIVSLKAQLAQRSTPSLLG